MADPVAGQSDLTMPAVAVETTGSLPVGDASSTPVTDTTSTAPSSWFESLPDGLKANPTLQNFKSKDFKDVAESLVNAEKLVGGSVRLQIGRAHV